MVLDFSCSLCSLSCSLSCILLVKLFWSCTYCIQVAQGPVAEYLHPHHITCTATGVLWRTSYWGTFMLQTPKSRRFSGSSARYWASLQKSCTRCVWYVHVCMLACLTEYNVGVSGWGGCPDIASFFTQMISATVRPSWRVYPDTPTLTLIFLCLSGAGRRVQLDFWMVAQNPFYPFTT